MSEGRLLLYALAFYVGIVWAIYCAADMIVKEIQKK